MEIIGTIVVVIVGWSILKVLVLYRIFPEWGLKDAERRYMENPTNGNERDVWKYRTLVDRKNR